MNSSEWDKMVKNIKTNSIYDEDGYDIFGWNAEEINKETQSKYDKDSFDMLGYNLEGYDREGYNRRGYDYWGYDREGYDREGYNKKGYNREGYDQEGYDRRGYDREGYNKKGYNREGYDKFGKHYQEEQKIYNKEKSRKAYLGLLNKAKKLAKGELSIQEYIKRSKMSIDELILFANKNEMGADVIRGLYRQKKLYKMYTKPFSKKKYLDSTTILVNGEPVKPTEQDVDKCIEFLKSKKEIICEKTVRDTVRAYLRGEIDITIKENISEEVNQSHDEELTELDLVAAEQKNLQGILQDVQQKSQLVQNQISDIENSQLSEKNSGRKM